MDRLIIESLLIFVITFLLFELLNKYIEIDKIIILILSFVIAMIYYMKQSGYEHMDNTPNEKTDKTSDENPEEKTDKTPDEKSEETPENKPDKTPDKNPKETPKNKPDKTSDENPENKQNESSTEIPEKQTDTILNQSNEAGFKVNNENTDGTLNYFSDKNIQKLKTGKAYDDTFTNHVKNNIDLSTTRNQFQTDNDDFNVNGHSNIPEKLEDISIEGLKDPTVITNENQYTQYGGYIDANSLYVPRDYQYTNDDYGWNFIPPLKWIDLPDQNAPRVPLCVSANGNCRVNASLTTGYPITVKTWNESRKVMGPSHIDTRYIKTHLNTAKPPENIKS